MESGSYRTHNKIDDISIRLERASLRLRRVIARLGELVAARFAVPVCVHGVVGCTQKGSHWHRVEDASPEHGPRVVIGDDRGGW